MHGFCSDHEDKQKNEKFRLISDVLFFQDIHMLFINFLFVARCAAPKSLTCLTFQIPHLHVRTVSAE
jgi:hypothetical protein